MRADDRKALERLCRYILRPPLAHDRLKWTQKGQVSVRLKRAWSDGTTHLLLTPAELVAKLVPLIPPPRVNRIRYHGVFSPNAKLRHLIVPVPDSDACEHDETLEPSAPSNTSYRARYTWSKLMARVFDFDVLECPKCRAKMQTIAFITEPDVIRKILKSVGFAADSPSTKPRENRQAIQLTMPRT